MEVVGEILEKLAHVEAGVKCEACGAVITMVGKQYTARCHQCGTFITLSPAFLARLKLLEYRAKYGDMEIKPKCSFCRDRGFVILQEQEDDHLGKYVYRCLCQAGQQRKEAWPVVPAAKIIHHRLALFQADTDEDAESRDENSKAAGNERF